MAVTLTTPAASFVKFTDTSVEDCIWGTVRMNLPVFEPEDVAFQFLLTADTKAEADELSAIGSDSVSVGMSAVGDPSVYQFEAQPERFRLSDTEVLYYWGSGVPGFEDIVDVHECFVIKVTVGETTFTSTTFERINEYDACFTAVIDYLNDDNGFGFNYCASNPIDIPPPTGGGGEGEEPLVCSPTRIAFTNMNTMIIPYTAQLVDAYGTIPTVQVWLYDEDGQLIRSEVEVKLTGYPPTEIAINFGGNASGIVIIK